MSDGFYTVALLALIALGYARSSPQYTYMFIGAALVVTQLYALLWQALWLEGVGVMMLLAGAHIIVNISLVTNIQESDDAFDE